MRRSLMIIVSMFTLLVVLAPLAAHAEEPSLYTVQQRMGVGVARRFLDYTDFPGRLSDFGDVESLGFGWYSDWSMTATPERPPGIEYVQMVLTKKWPPNETAIASVAAANPGSLWIIGNEPETRGQGQQTPIVYAERYHHLYTLIKDLDPTATIAIAGVVMPTPLRLEWLDQCLAAYETAYGEPMPVDVWNIHMQILQEKRGDWGCGIPYGLDDDEGRLYTIVDNCSVEIFEQLIWEFLAWLEAKGEQDKPLIISEYGVLMPSSYLPYGDWNVIRFMEGTSDFMLSTRHPQLGCAPDGNRIIQRWLWFSLNFPSYDEGLGDGFNGALYDWHNPSELTVFGDFYKAYALQARQVHHLALPFFVSPLAERGAFGSDEKPIAEPQLPEWAVSTPHADPIGERLSGIVLPSPAEAAAYLASLEPSGRPR